MIILENTCKTLPLPLILILIPTGLLLSVHSSGHSAMLKYNHKDPLKVRQPTVNVIISSYSSRRADSSHVVSSLSHQAKP